MRSSRFEPANALSQSIELCSSEPIPIIVNISFFKESKCMFGSNSRGTELNFVDVELIMIYLVVFESLKLIILEAIIFNF